MKREDRKSVASVIEEHCERLSLRQLAAKGTSHVRVISGARALELIEAVVDEVIGRRVGEVADRDRERIVEEAQQEFQRVSRIQAESETIIRDQKQQMRQLDEARSELRGRLKAEHRLRVESEKTTQLQAEALEGAQKNLAQAGERQRKVARMLKRYERRLINSRDTINSYDHEIERLSSQVKQDAALLDELRQGLLKREGEVQRLKGLMDGLSEEVAAARAKTAQPQSLDGLRAEMAEMKSFLEGLEERTSRTDAAAIETMLEKLSERDQTGAEQLEARFQATIDELDRIGKKIHAATAPPIDRAVEATDVVISQLFDDDAVMESNLEDLEVKVFTAKEGINKSLDRLRKLRGDAAASLEEDDQELGAAHT
ncbi:MAG: hypothetical protein O7E54_02440 [Planctomycetota bacterium]|jgi:chromosome segregation ATPase|nr:hypothetical protein [Planctomycetota bacterium]